MISFPLLPFPHLPYLSSSSPCPVEEHEHWDWVFQLSPRHFVCFLFTETGLYRENVFFLSTDTEWTEFDTKVHWIVITVNTYVWVGVLCILRHRPFLQSVLAFMKASLTYTTFCCVWRQQSERYDLLLKWNGSGITFIHFWIKSTLGEQQDVGLFVCLLWIQRFTVWAAGEHWISPFRESKISVVLDLVVTASAGYYSLSDCWLCSQTNIASVEISQK